MKVRGKPNAMVHVVSVKASRRTQKDDDGWNRFYTTYEAVVRAGKVRYQISCVDILYLNTKNEQTRRSVCDKIKAGDDVPALIGPAAIVFHPENARAETQEEYFKGDTHEIAYDISLQEEL